MRDNAIIIVVRDAVVTYLALRGIAADVLQANQPTQQGVTTGALVTMTKIADTRYGFPERKTVWDDDLEEMHLIQGEQIESTFQFNAQCPQNPASDVELTPADILKAVAWALQSEPTIDVIRTEGVSVLRVGTLRTGYTVDDHGQFAANPSFDVTFTHRDSTDDIIGVLSSTEVNIHRV